MKEISAGGIVYRKIGDAVQLLLIQDRYGKITLPKGKMEPGETIEETALREIAEETGIACEIRTPLETIRYNYSLPGVGAVNKEVHYYLAEATGGKLQAQVEEISGVEWLDPLEAWRQQRLAGYANNEIVVRKAIRELGFEVE
jgi:8-oxo-dGTP pyrophosphatase MutT (NUDIX family)